MTKLEIITKAQLYLDDTSELSTQEFSDLFDKMYRKITRMHTWEGTKKEDSSETTSTSVPYVALPTDFLYLTANANHSTSNYEAETPVIFRGTNYDEYQVVNWSDRRQYRSSNKAYVDFTNSRLYFTVQPTVAESVEFDYHGQATALTDNDSPWFPAEFHDAIYHYMVADDFAIQQSDKAKSYAKENWRDAEDIMADMKYWNSQLVII
jgi:hypothetical protein